MEVKHYIKEKILEIEITEEIDHHNSELIRNRIDYEIQKIMPKELILNLKNVYFMDSAGIGLIIGRYKVVKLYGGKLRVINVSQKLKRIFDMSGIQKIIEIKSIA